MLPDFTSSQANKIGAIKSPIMRGYLFISSWNLAPSSGDYSAAGQLPESNRLSKLFREVSLTFFHFFSKPAFPNTLGFLTCLQVPLSNTFLVVWHVSGPHTCWQMWLAFCRSSILFPSSCGDLQFSCPRSFSFKLY